jgi:hypothetical protein
MTTPTNQNRKNRKRYTNFGNKIISLLDLEGNPPILNIRYRNRSSIHDFRKTPISTELANELKNMIDGKNDLNDGWKKGLPSVVHPSGRQSPLLESIQTLVGLKRRETRKDPASRQRHIAQKKNELKVLLGVRDAGNDNPVLSYKIIQIAKYLRRINQLSAKTLDEIYEVLNENDVVHPQENIHSPDEEKHYE